MEKALLLPRLFLFPHAHRRRSHLLHHVQGIDHADVVGVERGEWLGQRQRPDETIAIGKLGRPNLRARQASRYTPFSE